MAPAPLALLEPGMSSTDRQRTESRYRTALAAVHGTGKSLSDTPSGPWHHEKRRCRVIWVAAGIWSTPQRAAGRLNAVDPYRQVRNRCHAKETLLANPTRCYSTRSHPDPKREAPRCTRIRLVELQPTSAARSTCPANGGGVAKSGGWLGSVTMVVSALRVCLVGLRWTRCLRARWVSDVDGFCAKQIFLGFLMIF